MSRASRRLVRAAAILACVAAAAAAIAPPSPELIERYYAQSFYPALQPRLTAVSNLVPFALLDAIAICGAVWTMLVIVHSLRGPGRRVPRIARLMARLLTAAAVVYLLFLACWGLNYRRVPAPERFSVDRATVTPEALSALADRTVHAVNATYRRSHVRGRGDRPSIDRLAPAFARVGDRIAAWEITPGRPKASAIAHSFPWTGVDGMINPLGLEVLLNPEVLPFERPFVLAHEWAHLAGHASEDEASFVGWLTCLEGDPAMQYSGWLALYLHVVRALPPDARRGIATRLDAGPRADLQAIQQRLARVQPVLREASWQVYDEYLRANRVPGGIASYDEVITLVLGAPSAWPHWRTEGLSP